MTLKKSHTERCGFSNAEFDKKRKKAYPKVRLFFTHKNSLPLFPAQKLKSQFLLRQKPCRAQNQNLRLCVLNFVAVHHFQCFCKRHALDL